MRVCFWINRLILEREVLHKMILENKTSPDKLCFLKKLLWNPLIGFPVIYKWEIGVAGMVNFFLKYWASNILILWEKKVLRYSRWDLLLNLSYGMVVTNVIIYFYNFLPERKPYFVYSDVACPCLGLKSTYKFKLNLSCRFSVKQWQTDRQPTNKTDRHSSDHKRFRFSNGRSKKKYLPHYFLKISAISAVNNSNLFSHTHSA